MKSASKEFESNASLCARFTRDAHSRFRARRRMFGQGARFDPRFGICGMKAEVFFVRRFAAQEHVGTMCVVPFEEQSRFFDHAFSRNRHENATSATVLERQDRPFRYGNRSVLANCTETLLDVVRFAPRFEFSGDELNTLIGYQALRFHAIFDADALHRGCDLIRGWLLFEYLEAHDAAGEMVDHDENIPTVGMNLRQRIGWPRSPEPVR